MHIWVVFLEPFLAFLGRAAKFTVLGRPISLSFLASGHGKGRGGQALEIGNRRNHTSGGSEQTEFLHQSDIYTTAELEVKLTSTVDYGPSWRDIRRACFGWCIFGHASMEMKVNSTNGFSMWSIERYPFVNPTSMSTVYFRN